jgi:TRAP-type uncharacterized transport system substrate-binding protein
MIAFYLLIILLFILYKINNNFFTQIDTIKKITIGIHDSSKSNLDQTQLMNELLNFAPDIYNYTIKYYTKQKNMLEDLNNKKIDFSVAFEDNVIDSVLGLNSYKNKLDNIRFITGLYFYHFYFISSVIFKDKNKSIPMKNLKDIKHFYKIYNRNLIIGTEEINSLSHNNLLLLLYIYGFKPINIEKKYDYIHSDIKQDNIVYYYCANIETIQDRYINNNLDAVFLVKPDKNKNIVEMIDLKDSLLLDIALNDTLFNELFSLYFYNKNIELNGSDNNIDTQYIFKTKSCRILLLNHVDTPDDISTNFIDSYYTHNNLIINSLLGKNSIDNHYLFEPLDMIYINKFIPIHESAVKYYKKMGYILDEKLKKKLENKKILDKNNFKHYWKYKQIGLQQFKL